MDFFGEASRKMSSLMGGATASAPSSASSSFTAPAAVVAPVTPTKGTRPSTTTDSLYLTLALAGTSTLCCVYAAYRLCHCGEGSSAATTDGSMFVSPEEHKLAVLEKRLAPRIAVVQKEMTELTALKKQREEDPQGKLSFDVYKRVIAVDEEITRLMLDIDGCQISSLSASSFEVLEAMRARRKALLQQVIDLASALKGLGETN